MAVDSEKREAHRALLGVKVSWTVDGRQWQEDESQDVSSTGMMLRTNHSIGPGTTLKLQFKLPNKKFDEPIMADAEVMRVISRQERQVGVGLRFVVLRSHDHRVVHEFVCRIIGLPLDEVVDGLGDRGEDGSSSYRMDRLLLAADKEVARRADVKLAREKSRLRKATLKTWRDRGMRIGLLLLLIVLATKVYGCMQVLNTLLPG